jgi:hypothetical protein
MQLTIIVCSFRVFGFSFSFFLCLSRRVPSFLFDNVVARSYLRDKLPLEQLRSLEPTVPPPPPLMEFVNIAPPPVRTLDTTSPPHTAGTNSECEV